MNNCIQCIDDSGVQTAEYQKHESASKHITKAFRPECYTGYRYAHRCFCKEHQYYVHFRRKNNQRINASHKGRRDDPPGTAADACKGFYGQQENKRDQRIEKNKNVRIYDLLQTAHLFAATMSIIMQRNRIICRNMQTVSIKKPGNGVPG